MLPPGLTADLVTGSYRSSLQRLHPPAKTVARLLVGACSCDLVRPRMDASIEDERELRARYGKMKLSRTDIIRELEWHRRGPTPRPKPPTGWTDALAGFVIEHARNAGPTLYLLDFGPYHADPRPVTTSAPSTCSVWEVRAGRTQWLKEGTPVIVS